MGDDQIVARRIAPPSTRYGGHLAIVICVMFESLHTPLLPGID